MTTYPPAHLKLLADAYRAQGGKWVRIADCLLRGEMSVDSERALEAMAVLQRDLTVLAVSGF
jgi:hypothetical protein